MCNQIFGILMKIRPCRIGLLCSGLLCSLCRSCLPLALLVRLTAILEYFLISGHRKALLSPVCCWFFPLYPAVAVCARVGWIKKPHAGLPACGFLCRFLRQRNGRLQRRLPQAVQVAVFVDRFGLFAVCEREHSLGCTGVIQIGTVYAPVSYTHLYQRKRERGGSD